MAVDAVNSYVVERIRRPRIAQRSKVAEAARRTGIPLGSYSCVETGRYRMSLECLFRALAVPGTDIADASHCLRRLKPRLERDSAAEGEG